MRKIPVIMSLQSPLCFSLTNAVGCWLNGPGSAHTHYLNFLFTSFTFKVCVCVCMCLGRGIIVYTGQKSGVVEEGRVNPLEHGFGSLWLSLFRITVAKIPGAGYFIKKAGIFTS